MIEELRNHPELLDIAFQAVSFAKEKKTVGDYKRYCMTLRRTLIDNYENRMRVMEFLINIKFIEKDEERLYLRGISLEPWIKELLLSGDKTVWELATAADKKSILTKKFDAERLGEIGLEGEKFVLSRLKCQLNPEVHRLVEHVSLSNDTLGFDIISPSVKVRNKLLNLEVKTSVRPSENFKFYISRNEFEKGNRNENWFLVFVKVINATHYILGHARPDIFMDFIPQEIDGSVKWESLKVEINPEWLMSGLP